MIGIAEREINRVNWSQFTELAGTAEAVGPALRELLSAPSPEAASRSYWKLENHIVAQGGVYASAEPSVSVLVAAFADERPAYVRTAILELLFQILNGSSAEPAEKDDHDDLLVRCRARAREGLWLLVREMVTGHHDAARDVLQFLDPEGLIGFEEQPAT